MLGSGRLRGVVGLGRFHRDARIFLATTLVAGAALSLYWIDFNLYLASLGYSTATIGLVATIASTAGALVAFPVSALSDRIGRRAVMAGGMGVAMLALAGLLLADALPLIALFAATWAIGQQSLIVVQAPFLTEHSDAEHRDELFALQAAIQTVTNILAAALGGFLATWLAGTLGLEAGGPGTYRIILVIMAVLLAVGLSGVSRLTDDPPATRSSPPSPWSRSSPTSGPPSRPG